MIIMFCTLLGLLSILTAILPDREISISERRYLTRFPTLNAATFRDGAFMQNLEKYLPDQFPARDGFRAIKAIFERATLRMDTSGIYSYRGYLASLDMSYNPEQIEKTGEKLSTVKNRLLSDGRHAYISLIPPKNYYISMENDAYPTADYEGMRELLLSLPSMEDFSYIELFDVLSLQDYYKTDSHWRSERLDPAVDALLSGMKRERAAANYDTHSIEGFRGVYAGQAALPVCDEIMYYRTSDGIRGATVKYIAADISADTVYTLDRANDIDMYDIFLGGAVPVIEILNEDAPAGKLVIFRDSYGSSIAPLLVDSYREIVLIDLRYIALRYIPDFTDTTDADFLFLYSTGVLGNSEMLRVN